MPPLSAPSPPRHYKNTSQSHSRMPSGTNQEEGQLQKGGRISNPQRLLIVTPNIHSHSTIPSFLHNLTGVQVSPQRPQNEPSTEDDNQSHGATFAGYTTHSPLQLNTKYYSADIPIWVDEIPIPTETPSSTTPSSQSQQEHDTPSTWSLTFLAPAAAEVRSAIGAVIILLQKPATVSPAIPSSEASEERDRVRGEVAALKDIVKAVADVRRKIGEERGEGSFGEVPGMVVLVGSDEEKLSKKSSETIENDEIIGPEMVEYGVRWWDEELADMGIYEFEVLNWDPAIASSRKEDEEEVKKRNEFGELEGMPRIREVLEANEWAMASSHEDATDLSSSMLEDIEEGGLGFEVGELEREMLGLRMAIERGGDDGAEDDFEEDDLQVEQLEALMQRVQAIRDMGAELPESERKKFAAKAIRDIMEDL
ncbi:hypothetical protein LOZ57_000401 [Ophidiomyces ophidiicola]|uniref:uncharacterized protein n=1 Tax=Ophidiomyces ophidiicola TaxID=1387563 RepID=UPI0020C44735|nr:uncharacterized protein LOZ57_000401 [Ophidiomyces ophidiicola]KAI1954056.1 hypothetical protein LOZ57_000401 [Ophidiomyces ophidiicola]KAI2049924.1 hypothetical protein LOZ43_005009 [Ophidiomyces ophidiicola]